MERSELSYSQRLSVPSSPDKMFNKGIQIETAQKQIGKVSVNSASLLAENHIKARADGAFGLRSGKF